MAQLRQDYGEFQERNVEVIALGPDGPGAFKRFWQEQDMPYIGLADIKSQTADLFYQEVNLLKLGRMPAVFIIDLAGQIRYSHYGSSMSDIPGNEEVLQALDQIQTN
jgi:peroxiredoxin Q/BCP